MCNSKLYNNVTFSRSSRSGNVGMLDNFGGSGGNLSYNTYGLSSGFLESLGINGPLHNKIFVANVSIN